jgi:hypothetical protein
MKTLYLEKVGTRISNSYFIQGRPYGQKALFGLGICSSMPEVAPMWSNGGAKLCLLLEMIAPC